MNKPFSMTYRDAGVDIERGDELVQRIKPYAQRTRRPELLAGIGGFSALFAVPINRYREPILVSGTDGVGTKLKLATLLSQHDRIGIDLVAMCVNDVIVTGAEPLFFLDYYATGVLNVSIAEQVIQGIARGCEIAGAALVGGETAEMPSMYAVGDYDLAGFCVGVVEKSRIIDGSQVRVGDAIIGIASSGLHSNGYSLVRKIIEVNQIDLQQNFNGRILSAVLLEPTRIYVKSLLYLLEKVPVHALAHITGGGLLDNIPRVLPAGTCACLDSQTWQQPAIFSWLAEAGNVAAMEMYRTFNCGVGMIACVAQSDVAATIKYLQDVGETAWVIGEITTQIGEERVIIR